MAHLIPDRPDEPNPGDGYTLQVTTQDRSVVRAFARAERYIDWHLPPRWVPLVFGHPSLDVLVDGRVVGSITFHMEFEPDRLVVVGSDGSRLVATVGAP